MWVWASVCRSDGKCLRQRDCCEQRLRDARAGGGQGSGLCGEHSGRRALRARIGGIGGTPLRCSGLNFV